MRDALALRDDELERIALALGREPTVVELHAFDAQWSEHCSYKSSRHHLKKLPVAGGDVALGPGEDSGILHLGEHDGVRYGIVIAHESHNHPSQVVPFEGAATGIGGIVRDVLCMGAEVIGVADPLRFGRVEDPGSHQRTVARGVVDGIGAYGNAIGVPNLAGDVYFDEGFDDNALVNVVAMGLVKLDEVVHSYAPPGAAGWDVVLVGKATDPSGFGGASFSSLVLDAGDEEANKGAVQVPDPFLKNVLMRASYRVFAMLRERKLVVGFKDLGAGGIMGCSAEIVSSGGFGAQIDLDAVNVAVEGMPPEVVAVGETQERLIWVLPPEITPEVLRIYNEEFTLPEIAYNARAVRIGGVTAERRYVLRHRGTTVMDVDIEFLTGSIRDELPYVECTRVEPARRELPAVDVETLLPKILAHRDVCSREPLYRRYDWVVRGRTVLPRGAADAGVLAPVPGARLGVALAVAGNPRIGRLDARYAGAHAVLEAVRRVIAVGARPIGLTDCLNFGNPRKPEQYGEFVAAVEGLSDAARALDLAFVSGNVSLYNESKSGRAVPASPIVACVGAVRDVGHVVSPGLRRAGSALLWIGSRELAVGGSVLAEIAAIEGDLPAIDYVAENEAMGMIKAGIARGSVLSCRAVGDGGMLVALARLAFDAYARGRRLGFEIDFANPFCETGGFVCEVTGDSELDLSGALRVGTTLDRPEIVANGSRFGIAELRRVWSQPLEEVYP
ncbi:MAG TPA: phosphoribosylformylglycinamidine synthase subunit PurL [Verrucomicrobiae bacterium]|nr:phosphoribosylformylglycinamidine synthase subunit PurL [Verrucomicrobiae bacterium]